MNGDEKMRPETLGEMNINSWVKVCGFFQRALYWCRGTVGSTTPRTSFWITLNWKYYSNMRIEEMTGNIVHEWIHLLGFEHHKGNLDEQVTYVVGEITENMAREILQREKLKPFI